VYKSWLDTGQIAQAARQTLVNLPPAG